MLNFICIILPLKSSFQSIPSSPPVRLRLGSFSSQTLLSSWVIDSPLVTLKTFCVISINLKCFILRSSGDGSVVRILVAQAGNQGWLGSVGWAVGSVSGSGSSEGGKEEIILSSHVSLSAFVSCFSDN